jgi:hypothetical protein
MKYLILATLTLSACKEAAQITGEQLTKAPESESCWSESFTCTAHVSDDWNTGISYIQCDDPNTRQYEQNVYIPSTDSIDKQTRRIHSAINKQYQADKELWPYSNEWAWNTQANSFFGQDAESEIQVATDWVISDTADLNKPTTIIKLLNGQDPEQILGCKE